MFDHVTLAVSDVPRAVRSYRQALEPLGYRLQAGSSAQAHVALRAPSRAGFAAFHRAALASGATDNGAPGLRESYGPTCYAAFTHDPDGNNVEAVTHGQ